MDFAPSGDDDDFSSDSSCGDIDTATSKFPISSPSSPHTSLPATTQARHFRDCGVSGVFWSGILGGMVAVLFFLVKVNYDPYTQPLLVSELRQHLQLESYFGDRDIFFNSLHSLTGSESVSDSSGLNKKSNFGAKGKGGAGGKKLDPPPRSISASVSPPYLISLISDPYTPVDWLDDGIVLVTDSRGEARDLVLMLAARGIHVLAGVSSEREKRTFLFERQRGVEPIVLDVEEPKDIVAAIYRIRELNKDLGRHLVGVVINALYIESPPLRSKEDGMKHAKQQQRREREAGVGARVEMVNAARSPPPEYVNGLDVHFGMSMDSYDSVMKRMVKSTVRIVDASLKLWSEPTPHNGRVIIISRPPHTIDGAPMRTGTGAQPGAGVGIGLSKDMGMVNVGRAALEAYCLSLESSLRNRGAVVSVSNILVPIVHSPPSVVAAITWELELEMEGVENDGTTIDTTSTESGDNYGTSATATSSDVTVLAVLHALLAENPRPSYQLP